MEEPTSTLCFAAETGSTLAEEDVKEESKFSSSSPLRAGSSGGGESDGVGSKGTYAFSSSPATSRFVEAFKLQIADRSFLI